MARDAISLAQCRSGVLYFNIEKNSCHTHGWDGPPDQVSDVSGTSPTVRAPTVWAKEVRDMDAGPSHSRPLLFACLLAGPFFSSSGMMDNGIYLASD